MPHRLPLHEQHAAAGATFETIGDWELPVSYGDPGREYAAARDHVALIDRSHYGVLEVTGRDRAAFLHAMLSNDITRLRSGEGCGATLLDVHGKVQVVVTVLALEDRILVVTPPGMSAITFEALDKYLFSEKAYFKDVTDELALLGLVGPEAPTVTERVAGAAPADQPWSHVTGALHGRDVRLVSGGGETGLSEVWFLTPVGNAEHLWRAAVEAGARPLGTSAVESLRIEAGTPLYGRDVDASVLLPEIPLAGLVSYAKGCYIGQEVVVRIRDRGHVNRHLVGLTLAGDRIPPAGASVEAGATAVGKVTSATWSFGLARPIALAFVRRQHAEPGTAVAVEVDGQRFHATVAALPFPR